MSNVVTEGLLDVNLGRAACELLLPVWMRILRAFTYQDLKDVLEIGSYELRAQAEDGLRALYKDEPMLVDGIMVCVGIKRDGWSIGVLVCVGVHERGDYGIVRIWTEEDKLLMEIKDWGRAEYDEVMRRVVGDA